ncbi:MAG TPA: TerC family protein [Burkholderiales bacterium]|nr:TerC family protein [Burkholderiales bacterium]
MEMLSDPLFWAGLGSITLINIVLSGDNAVVIALAARSLPAHQRAKAVMWGAGAAVIMRIILTIIAVEMLKWPYLKIIGALLLFWIAVKLLVPEDGDDDIEGSDNLVKAIKTILIADLVMSLDNVIGVAAAAKGNMTLLVLGLAISIPIVIFGATMLMKLMEKWPIIITIGAGLLGWVAGEMLLTDPAWASWISTTFPWLHVHLGKVDFNWVQVAGAAFVILVGKHLAKKAEAHAEAGHKIVDLAASDAHNKVTK